ncbi:MAG: DUF3667 domain-containing protein, partial [Rhizomicrobium sp.]
PYCAHCGQSTNTHRRRVGTLLHEFLNDIISFDSRILRTAWALMFQPGELAQAFREGRSQSYVPAVRLYLFVSLFFFVILSFGHIAIMQMAVVDGHRGGSTVSVGEAGGAGSSTLKPVFFAPFGAVHNNLSDPAVQRLQKLLNDDDVNKTHAKNDWAGRALMETLRKLSTDAAALNGTLTEWIPRAMVLFLPSLALLLWVLYLGRRKDFFFVDHLIFVLNLHSFSFVATLMGGYLAQDFNRKLVAGAFFFWFLLYLALSLRRFYGQSWLATVTKGTVLALGYFTMLMLTFVSVLIIGVFNG